MQPELANWLFLVGAIAFSGLISPSAVAQIIPDHTLGEESSVIVPEVEINGLDSDRPCGDSSCCRAKFRQIS